jgi:selenide, water dikinase
LAVTGMVKKEYLKKNNTVRENDALYLTKPLGSGVYATAMKRGLLKEQDYPILIDTLTGLNKIGEELGRLGHVTAITDVTGFGLAGHLLEMLSEQKFAAHVVKKQIPVFDNLSHYTGQFIFPDNTTRNLNACSSKVKGMTDLDFITYCDPQTSGGLLFTVKAADQNIFEDWLKEKQYFAQCIGKIVSGDGTIEFV